MYPGSVPHHGFQHRSPLLHDDLAVPGQVASLLRMATNQQHHTKTVENRYVRWDLQQWVFQKMLVTNVG